VSALLQCREVTKTYQMGDSTVVALDRVNLAVYGNEYLAILGSSGSGKSTMMNILGCLDNPTSGEYHLNGRDVAQLSDSELAQTRNREIGFIFQSFNLLPRASALENVARPLSYRGVPRAERQERASEALRTVGLDNRMHHLPNELSGGQRQRVAIARALCGKPAILLADEPTGNLDSATARDIIALFESLHGAGHTIILITHEPKIAARCDRSITLADGRIVNDQPSRRLYAV
jgi:putative ABC transport system ATP-binding protein